VTWESVNRMEEYAGLPFMLKGIATAEDAALAVEHGLEPWWAPVESWTGNLVMLPEILDAVGGKAEIFLDGGALRGIDVLKAVALGATAVAIGKLQGWGLAADGKDRLVRVLEILEEEMRVAMGLLGVTSVDQLIQCHVCKAEATTLPHEMSAWVNMPEGRLL
jgi:isopentenyl diphosphate isomerase/L-lactate dehydrogenase-like FMN-dependent dehydrogenase